MRIKKINENQLEVILDLKDLKINNISIHSFMCNSSASQNLYFNILCFANNEINFKLKNYEIIIESYAIPSQNTFVLVITRVPKSTCLHTPKTQKNKFKINKSFFLKFDKFEDLCMFCNLFKNNTKHLSSLYLLNGCYFLYIKFNKINDYIKLSTIANEYSSKIYNNKFFLSENSKVIIKNTAIQTCKKYFV